MSAGVEHCPRCRVVPLRSFTNGWGGAFLTCLRCGYAERITRQPDIMDIRGGTIRYLAQNLGVNKGSRLGKNRKRNAVPHGAQPDRASTVPQQSKTSTTRVA